MNWFFRHECFRYEDNLQMRDAMIHTRLSQESKGERHMSATSTRIGFSSCRGYMHGRARKPRSDDLVWVDGEWRSWCVFLDSAWFRVAWLSDGTVHRCVRGGIARAFVVKLSRLHHLVQDKMWRRIAVYRN